MQTWTRRLVTLAVLLAIGGAFYYAMRERPISVDATTIAAGPMQVSISEEGVTRVRDVYTVSSPMAGHLDRIKLEEGQAVVANETIVASIHPLDSPFLDERTRRELTASAAAAQSAVALAEVELQRSNMALELAQSEYKRALALSKKKIVSASQLEKTYNALQLLQADISSKKAAIQLRKAELNSVQARLQQPVEIDPTPVDKDCCVEIKAPVDGVVLKILARSEQPVSPATQLVEIGDPQNLEIVVDLLSSDATKIEAGGKVLVTDWGGSDTLVGTVRRIDPAAFTKVSSLGIEEQRVNVIIDLDNTPKTLGHGYRVLASLVTWEQKDVLQVPIGALFRSDGNWAVFAINTDRIELRQVSLGQMNDKMAQITDGLKADERVVLYPNDKLEDGTLIEFR